MKVRLLKKYTPHSRELKKDTEMEVSNEKGRLWVEKKIAIEIHGLTKNEKKLDEIIQNEIVQAAEDELEMTVQIEKAAKRKNRK